MVRWMNGSVPGGRIALSRSAAPPVSRMVGCPDGRLTTPMSRQNTPRLKSGAQGLGAGLLGGELLGVGGGPSGPPVGAALLGLGEATGDEALAEARQRLLDALDVAEVAADADDHRRRSADARPSAIAMRIAFTASARPTKIASPMRKWPMLSSTICGKAAMRRAVS